MNIQEVFEQLASIFDDDGTPCDYGCGENAVNDMIQYVKTELAPLPYCVVEDWIWIDISVPRKVQELFMEQGVQPSVIYARTVVDDEIERGFPNLRTSPFVALHRSCIFQTRNTAYILCGAGQRTVMDAKVYAMVEW
ncbi:MAG: hypothetical protein H6995_09245 [Pseudomonadales bacterium]|nr:hypothetical protein [Pseudomonadales bacterium]MCP5215179.1 hypothetical protein [Pseudomonadales bacterium]